MAVSPRRRGKVHRDLSLKGEVKRITPEAARYFVWDAALPGFGLDVWPSGTRTWCVFYRVDGVQRRMTLGSADLVAPDEARRLAVHALAAAREGRDPLLERKTRRADAVTTHKAKREAATFADVAERYIETLRAKRSPRWAKEAQRILEGDILAVIGRRPIAELAVRDVERLHEAMRDRPFLANRAKAIVSAVVETAIRHGDRPLALQNPAHAVENYPEPPRERSLAPDEWAALAAGWAAFRAEIADVPAWDTRPAQLRALEALALTGARVGAMLPRRARDVSLEARSVAVTPTHKHVSRILLGSAALRLFADLTQGRGRDDYLFPGQTRRSRADAAPIAGVAVAWERLRELSGVADLRLHDLRKAFSGVGTELGVSTFVIGGLLGHAAQGVTERHYGGRPDALLLAAADEISEQVATRLGLTGGRAATIGTKRGRKGRK